MSSSKSASPTIAALFRIVHQSVNQKLAEWLAASPYNDLQPAHCAAVQAIWKHPEGARLTAMAQTARITKQSMSTLVDHLQRTGYIERAGDPDDGRALRLRLTERGLALGKDVRAFAQRLEADWCRRVGDQRIQELRETLTQIIAAEP